MAAGTQKQSERKTHREHTENPQDTLRRITLHFLCSSKLSRLSSGILGQALEHTNRKERNSPRGIQGLIPQCIISRDFS